MRPVSTNSRSSLRVARSKFRCFSIFAVMILWAFLRMCSDREPLAGCGARLGKLEL